MLLLVEQTCFVSCFAAILRSALVHPLFLPLCFFGDVCSIAQIFFLCQIFQNSWLSVFCNFDNLATQRAQKIQFIHVSFWVILPDLQFLFYCIQNRATQLRESSNLNYVDFIVVDIIVSLCKIYTS